MHCLIIAINHNFRYIPYFSPFIYMILFYSVIIKLFYIEIKYLFINRSGNRSNLLNRVFFACLCSKYKMLLNRLITTYRFLFSIKSSFNTLLGFYRNIFFSCNSGNTAVVNNQFCEMRTIYIPYITVNCCNDFCTTNKICNKRIL